MAGRLLTSAKNINKSSRAVALSAMMYREPPTVHCLITQWGYVLSALINKKLWVASQPENYWKKRYCRKPLCYVETISCSLSLTEWPSEGLWSSPIAECICLPCDTDMHLSLAELKGEGEMVHSKQIAILPVTAREHGSSRPKLLYDYTVAALPQSLLGWPTFSFFFLERLCPPPHMFLSFLSLPYPQGR